MNRPNDLPEISVIIPVLQEARILPQLLRGLARQRGVALEIIFSDGGSRDGSEEVVRTEARTVALPVVFVPGKPGRTGQLNRGAELSRGESLLFLHADSCFPDPDSLRTSLDHLRSASRSCGRQMAGKFRLRFDRSRTDHPFGYYYHESKARLLRRECTHGDQGLLLPRALFHRFGPFDEKIPILAETRLADRILDQGMLALLPTEIRTSARRFETEGLAERQTLNAVIMNFAALEWASFFDAFPAIYPNQDQAGPLPLRQVLQGVARLMGSLPLRERLALWYRTGGYVRSNAWQLAFACDSLRNFRRGIGPGAGDTPLLHAYDRHVNDLTDNAVGRFLAALLVRLWFGCTALR